jgi:hypothetical protein
MLSVAVSLMVVQAMLVGLTAFAVAAGLAAVLDWVRRSTPSVGRSASPG